jgi:hypothetical protein
MKPFRKYCILFFLLLVACGSASAEIYRISWQPNPELNIAGYKLYYGNRSRTYDYCLNMGQSVECLVSVPDTGVFCVAVTAFDTSGNESDYSKEVIIDFRPAISLTNLFQLLPNYPNPFNPETIIPYRLNRPARIEFDIFDLVGRKVLTLDSGDKPEGTHLVLWRGIDQRGLAVANGVYICRLRIGNLFKTSKIILIR